MSESAIALSRNSAITFVVGHAGPPGKAVRYPLPRAEALIALAPPPAVPHPAGKMKPEEATEPRHRFEVRAPFTTHRCAIAATSRLSASVEVPPWGSGRSRS